jgi:hypothetical protein
MRITTKPLSEGFYPHARPILAAAPGIDINICVENAAVPSESFPGTFPGQGFPKFRPNVQTTISSAPYLNGPNRFSDQSFSPPCVLLILSLE